VTKKTSRVAGEDPIRARTEVIKGRATDLIAGPELHGEILPPGQKTRKPRAPSHPEGKAVSTQEQASNAGSGSYRVDVPGVEGLYLEVGDNGAGSWVKRYRAAGGNRRYLGLGPRNKVKLAEAIGLAQDADALRRRNVDPIDERGRLRAEAIAKARAAKPVTLREATEMFVAERGGSWKHKYARQCWIAPLEIYVFSKFGRLSVDAIAIADVAAAVRAAEAAGVPKTGARIKARIKTVLDFAIGKGWRSPDKINPAAGDFVMTHRNSGERPHFPAVDLDDAQEIFRQLKRRIEGSSAIAAWAFMILTASRPSEALNAQWDEIDWDKKLWTVPPGRMKAKRAHAVPLSAEALEVLERQARIRSGDAVFPGRSGSPVSYCAFALAPARANPPIDAASPHSWRSIFRDWAGDIGDVPRELAEAALAHTLGSVEAAYRKRTAVEKRRKAMEDYADWLLRDGSKVLAFPRPVEKEA
jgi:integrase